MKPLRVALLWHHHQPYYRVDDRFALPWVRLHAAKDYNDLALVHLSHPHIAMTYNIVPSLLRQLREYDEGVEDEVQSLSGIPAQSLTTDHKKRIAEIFFLCHHPTMLMPYARYHELYRCTRHFEQALQELSDSDWRDIQVWYNLVWIGPVSRGAEYIKRLFDKARDFTEQEKQLVLSHHKMLMRSVVPTMRQLYTLGQAELSVTPLYHPILPLLLDTNVAREAIPNVTLPQHRYRQEQDAEWQVRRAQQVFAEVMHCSAKGMWCSEGAVSNEVLRLLAQCDVMWTATDEHVLRNSKKDYTSVDKYFPYIVREERRQPITLFFRDHALSDAIGFEYQHWNAHDAAKDFVRRLHKIREEIVLERGEHALDDAVVPVILDGENCWEFYHDNGRPFLHALYSLLGTDDALQTITFSKACEAMRGDHPYTLPGIVAGSWIHGTFDIWIGHEEKNAAWDALHAARTLAGTKRVGKQQWKQAMEHIYAAEGSDWFWWYGDDHRAASRQVFDELFRYHLRCVYELYNEDVPAVLRKSIMRNEAVREDMRKDMRKDMHKERATEYSTMHRND